MIESLSLIDILEAFALENVLEHGAHVQGSFWHYRCFLFSLLTARNITANSNGSDHDSLNSWHARFLGMRCARCICIIINYKLDFFILTRSIIVYHFREFYLKTIRHVGPCTRIILACKLSEEKRNNCDKRCIELLSVRREKQIREIYRRFDGMGLRQRT